MATITDDEGLFQGTMWDDQIILTLGQRGDDAYPGDVEATIVGRDGNDTIKVDAFALDSVATTTIYGDDGADKITALTRTGGDAASAATNEIHGGDGEDTIRIKAGNFNTAYGDDGADIITSNAADGKMNTDAEASNHLYGGDGDDRITAKLNLGVGYPEEGKGIGINYLEGGNGDDRLSATIASAVDGTILEAHSELLGGAGNDRLSVRGGDGNILNGGTGNDTLLGSAGSDTLIGLGGDDYLRGRGGEDTFLFGAIRNGEQDRIVDFVIGEDKIDLSQIDANTSRGGNQDFTFGTREGTGRVWIEEASRGSSSVLHADTGTKVLTVVIQDGADVGIDAYHASDFLL